MDEDQQRSGEKTLDLPEDVRQWTDERTLMGLLFNALDTVGQESEGCRRDGVLPLGQPRVLLTLLVYSYAIGLLDSEIIARQVPLDPQLRYLAAMTVPTAGELRRFRRHQRPWLKRTLSALLQSVWNHHRPASGEQSFTMPSEGCFASEAEERIDQAVLQDTMDLDY
jgi:hypothetical protein